MRRIIAAPFSTAALFSIAALFAAAPLQAQDAKAHDVMEAARNALGGADQIAGIKTILAKGKHQRSMGQVQANGETEISAMLPDKYLRSQTDQIFGNTVTVETGFNGGEPLQHTNSMGGPGGGAIIRMAGPGGPGAQMDPAEMKAAMLRAQQADFARVMLGWLATAPEYLEATYSYAGEAESPDGRADVIEVKGKDGFAAKLFIDQESHRPLMLTYMGRQPIVRIVRSERSPDEPSRRAGQPAPHDAERASPPPMVEMQVYFDDYRDVGGVLLPHRLSRSVNGEPNEEIEFEAIRINTDIKPATFDAK
jgi:hypothetical protein